MIHYLVLIFVNVFGVSYAQSACPAGGVFAGPGVAQSPAPTPVTGPMTFIFQTKGTVNCYGLVKDWTFRLAGGCPTDTDFPARFEVWRAGYVLVGFNTYSQDDCVDLGGGLVRLMVTADARIPHQPLDILGWSLYAGATVTIPAFLGAGAGTTDFQDCSGVGVGGTCTTTNVGTFDQLLQATLVQGLPPSLDNLPSQADVLEIEAVPHDVYRVYATHPRNSPPAAVDIDTETVLVTLTLSNTDFSVTPVAGTVDAWDLSLETAPDYETQTQYTVDVTVTALGLTDTKTFTVNVQDVNEPHVLTNLPTTAFMSALTPTCQTNEIITIQFTDQDAVDLTNPKSFAIISSTPNVATSLELQPPIRIDSATGQVFCTSAITTWREIDGLSYDVDVSVSDDMHDVRGVLTVIIQQPHTAPVITNLGATQQLSEAAAPGPIFTVEATSTNVNDIRFVLVEFDYEPHFDFFDLDPISGLVSLTSSARLDFTLTPSYKLTINVEDSLHDLDPGQQKVLTVNLDWVNRDPRYDPDVYVLTIEEECGGDQICNATAGSYSWPIPDFSLTIYDRDATETTPPAGGDSLTCTVLPSGFGDNYFDFDSGAGADCTRLFIRERMDLDGNPDLRQINLTVRVQDSGGVTHGDLAKIYITVVDINDNRPEFVSPGNPYTATIPENTPGGVSLFQVSAADADYNLNGEVRYYLDNDPAVTHSGLDYFQIDTYTGLVTTKQFADYESLREIRFRVFATDRGSPPWPSDPESAVVYITDVNDWPPVWNQTFCDSRPNYFPYNKSANCFFNDELRADTLVGYHVMTIDATDVDTPNAALTYHLLQPNLFFELGEVSGDIRVNSSLSAYVKYILYCYSEDGGAPNLLTQPHLRVRIDTFDPSRQLINIVLEVPFGDFDTVVIQEDFLVQLQKVLAPWFPKIDQYSLDRDKTTVSIYALTDTATYDEDNLAQPKHFVDRNDLLRVLRKNMQGTPADVLLGPDFDRFGPILVEPAYPIWIIDTIPGIITLAFICLAFLALVLGLILGLCHRYEKCCFKKRLKAPERNWDEPKNLESRPEDDQYDRLNNEETDTPPPSRGRRDSTDTIHSRLYTYGHPHVRPREPITT